MDKLGPVFAKKMKKMGISKKIEASLVCEEAQKNIQKFFSESDFEILYFKKGTLTISVKSAVIAQEVMLKKNFFMNDKIKKYVVKII